MTGQAKIELLLELKNRINTGLAKAKDKVNKYTGDMKNKINSLKDSHVKAFRSMRNEIPTFGSSISAGLSKAKENIGKYVGGIKKRIINLKTSHIKAFQAMRNEIPLFGRAMDLLGNPYVLMIAGVVAVTALFGKAIGEAAKFEHEFLQIKQLNLYKPAAELDKYKTKILDVSMSTGLAATDTAKAFYDIQSATGLFGNDVAAITQKVGKFSIATGAKLPDAVNQTVRAMKAFGLGVNDIDSLLIANAKTVQTGIVTFADLAAVQTEYAGAAAGAGQTIDTANKLFAVFTSIAGKASTGAIMVKSAFEGLTQKNTIKELELMGVIMYDDNDKMRDMSDILRDVSAKFKNMSPKAIDAVINKIGGPDGLKNMFVKLNTNSEDFFKTLELYDSSKFDLDKALKNAQGDFVTLKSIVGNQFNTVMIKLGEKILPSVANFLQKVSESLKSVYGNFDDIFGILQIVIPVIGGAIVIWKLWTAAQWLLNVAMSSNPIGAIITVVAVLTTGVILLVKYFHQVKDWFIKFPVWVKILTVVLASPLLPLIALAGAIRFVIDNFEHLKVIFTAVWSQVKRDFSFAKDSILYGIEKMWLKFKDIGEKIKNIFSNIGRAIKMALSGDFSGFKDILKSSYESKYSAEKTKVEEAKLDRKYRRKKTIYDVYNAKDISTIKEATGKFRFSKEKKGPEISIEDEEATTDETIPTIPVIPTSETPTEETDGGISEITGSAKQVRNVTVNIDSFVKGGINTQNTELQQMDASQIEQWFSEMILRTIRSYELG